MRLSGIFHFISKIYDKLYSRVQTKIHQQQYQDSVKLSREHSTIQWPFYQRTEQKDEFCHFLSYELDEYGIQTNSQNILFCVGPQGSGKTWMMKDIIKNEKSGQIKITINSDHFYSFQNYIQDLKEKLINEIDQNQDLEAHHILNLLMTKNDPSYINLHYNQVLNFIEENTWEFKSGQLLGEEILQYRIHTKQNNQSKLPVDLWGVDKDINEEGYTQNSYNKLIDFEQSIIQIADLVKVGSQKESIIKICLTILQNSELEESSNDISGFSMKQMNFLLDLLNFSSGLLDQNFQIISKLDQKRPTQEYSIIFQNFDRFLSLYPHSSQVYGFLDYLLLRCYNDTGIRNHIPIVIESSDCQFFNRDIYEMMSVNVNSFFCVDVLHLSKVEIQDQVGQLFTMEDFDVLYDILGGSLKGWYQLVQQYVEQEDFDLKQWIHQKMNPTVNDKDYSKFLNTMYQVFSSIETSDLLDKGDLEVQLLEILNIIIKENGRLFTGRHYNDVALLQNPIIICLQKLRILYHPKYLSELSLTNKIYLRYVIHFKNDLQLKVDQQLSRKTKILRHIREMLPFQDTISKTNYFNVERKRVIPLLQDAYDPRERQFRDDKKGVRPYHSYLN